MVKDRRWNTWVGVGNLLDLIGQPEHHFSQKLGVGFKHISSMSLVWHQDTVIRTKTLKRDEVRSFSQVDYLDVLTQEEGAHIRRRWGRVWAEQLAGGYRLFFTLLALPELQQRFQNMETVLNSSQAEQGRRCCVWNQWGWLEDKKKKT